MQFDLAEHPPKNTIRLLALLLETITKANDAPLFHQAVGGASLQRTRPRSQSFSQPSPYTRFHARTIPSIGIQDYLQRILKYCPCPNECFLALLVYFDRMAKTSKGDDPFHIDSYNIHRLIITGVMVSSKLFSDVFFTNTRYAKVGGLPVKELNELELEFLHLNRFKMFITVEDLQYYGDQLLNHGHATALYHNSSILPSQPPKADHEMNASRDVDPLRVQTKARQLSMDDNERAELVAFNDNRRSHSRPDPASRPTNASVQAAKRQELDPLPTPPGSSPPCDQAVASPSPSFSHESRSF